MNSRGVLVFPIAVYSHSQGCSITGGYVYRGKAVASARGRYFYGDYCSGTVWSLRTSRGKLTSGPRREPFSVGNLSSFGEDAAGELYATSLDGTVYKLGSLASSSAANLRPLLAEGGVRERLQRLVQRAQLVRRARGSPRCGRGAVQLLQLGARAVEPLEHRVELPVVERLPVSHAAIVRSASSRAAAAGRARRPAASIATSNGEACRPRTNAWCSSSVTAYANPIRKAGSSRESAR